MKPPKNFIVAELVRMNAFERISGWLARIFKVNKNEVDLEAGKFQKEYIETTSELLE